MIYPSLIVCIRYFNSRPSARGDCLAEGLNYASMTISIHAPPRGATRVARLSCRALRHFNSRPSARGDVDDPENYQQMVISIHAPPRGATTAMHRARSSSLFQFTPLREGRQERDESIYDAKAFQFTPLREGRRPHLEQLGRHIYFNSRPSARGDRLLWADLLRNRISIHAPPRGATMRALLRSGVQNISIHAPPRGATCRFQNSREAHIFQFTPLREGRLGG